MLDPRRIRSPYVRTKWAVEFVVRKAAASGALPNGGATIYPSGMLSGHSGTERGHPRFFPDRYLRGGLEAGVAAAS